MENIILIIIQTQIEMSQSIKSQQSQVFIQFQEFLQKRYVNEKKRLGYLMRELIKAQDWNYEEMESWRACEDELRDEEWTMGYNQLIEIKEDFEDEEAEIERQWTENEKRKPQMIC
tara:strand:+ start:189 stop:536 length:348 start_codon:yes stop_codon:yes gene_type:complete